MDVQPGQVARVRSRQYLINEVVPPSNPGDQTLVRLSCLDDDAQGQPLEVLWETEVDAEVVGETSWARVAEKGFDPPRLFAAYLHTLRWSCVTSTDPKLFQSPYRAGIQVAPEHAEAATAVLGHAEPVDPFELDRLANATEPPTDRDVCPSCGSRAIGAERSRRRARP